MEKIFEFIELSEYPTKNAADMNKLSDEFINSFNDSFLFSSILVFESVKTDDDLPFDSLRHNDELSETTQATLIILQYAELQTIPEIVLANFPLRVRFIIIYSICFISNIFSCDSNEEMTESYETFYNTLFNAIDLEQFNCEDMIETNSILFLCEKINNPNTKEGLPEYLYKILNNGPTFSQVFCLRLIIKYNIKLNENYNFDVSKFGLKFLNEEKATSYFSALIFELVSIYGYNDLINISRKMIDNFTEACQQYLDLFTIGIELVNSSKSNNCVVCYYTMLCEFLEVFWQLSDKEEELINESLETVLLKVDDVSLILEDSGEINNDVKAWIEKYFISRKSKQYDISVSSVKQQPEDYSHDQNNTLIVNEEQKSLMDNIVQEIKLTKFAKTESLDFNKLSAEYISLDMHLPVFGYEVSNLITDDNKYRFCSQVCDAFIAFYVKYENNFFNEYVFYSLINLLCKVINSYTAIIDLLQEMRENDDNNNAWIVIIKGLKFKMVKKDMTKQDQKCINNIIEIMHVVAIDSDLEFIQKLLKLFTCDTCYSLMKLYASGVISDEKEYHLQKVLELEEEIILLESHIIQISAEENERECMLTDQYEELLTLQRQYEEFSSPFGENEIQISEETGILIMQNHNIILASLSKSNAFGNARNTVLIGATKEFLNECWLTTTYCDEEMLVEVYSFVGILISNELQYKNDVFSEIIDNYIKDFDFEKVAVKLCYSEFPKNQTSCYFLILLVYALCNKCDKTENESLHTYLLSFFSYYLTAYMIDEVLDCICQILLEYQQSEYLTYLLFSGIRGIIGRKQKSEFFSLYEKEEHIVNTLPYESLGNFLFSIYSTQYSEDEKLDEEMTKFMYLHKILKYKSSVIDIFSDKKTEILNFENLFYSFEKETKELYSFGESLLSILVENENSYLIPEITTVYLYMFLFAHYHDFEQIIPEFEILSGKESESEAQEYHELVKKYEKSYGKLYKKYVQSSNIQNNSLLVFLDMSFPLYIIIDLYFHKDINQTGIVELSKFYGQSGLGISLLKCFKIEQPFQYKTNEVLKLMIFACDIVQYSRESKDAQTDADKFFEKVDLYDFLQISMYLEYSLVDRKIKNRSMIEAIEDIQEYLEDKFDQNIIATTEKAYNQIEKWFTPLFTPLVEIPKETHQEYFQFLSRLFDHFGVIVYLKVIISISLETDPDIIISLMNQIIAKYKSMPHLFYSQDQSVDEVLAISKMLDLAQTLMALESKELANIAFHSIATVILALLQFDPLGPSVVLLCQQRFGEDNFIELIAEQFSFDLDSFELLLKKISYTWSISCELEDEDKSLHADSSSSSSLPNGFTTTNENTVSHVNAMEPIKVFINQLIAKFLAWKVTIENLESYCTTLLRITKLLNIQHCIEQNIEEQVFKVTVFIFNKYQSDITGQQKKDILKTIIKYELVDQLQYPSNKRLIELFMKQKLFEIEDEWYNNRLKEEFTVLINQNNELLKSLLVDEKVYKYLEYYIVENTGGGTDHYSFKEKTH